ncbi:hypothetical protein DsansV1_C06g0064981 [Dioscorea sansibarensis]
MCAVPLRFHFPLSCSFRHLDLVADLVEWRQLKLPCPRNEWLHMLKAVKIRKKDEKKLVMNFLIRKSSFESGTEDIEYKSWIVFCLHLQRFIELSLTGDVHKAVDFSMGFARWCRQNVKCFSHNMLFTCVRGYVYI